jgi:16S rRNA (guanine1207-N2)-methyltransferase
LPGVFAHGRVDKGSRLLLDSLEKLRPEGKILDFACGSGVIGCALLAAGARVELTLLDVSALALEASGRTLSLNGMKAALLPSDGLSELEGRYDWIISNPPFHRGVSNDLEIAEKFFAEAGTFLTENGRIVIVCNRHLPYASWLQNHFDRVERLDENSDFVIIQAGKPRKH